MAMGSSPLRFMMGTQRTKTPWLRGFDHFSPEIAIDGAFSSSTFCSSFPRDFHSWLCETAGVDVPILWIKREAIISTSMF